MFSHRANFSSQPHLLTRPKHLTCLPQQHLLCDPVTHEALKIVGCVFYSISTILSTLFSAFFSSKVTLTTLTKCKYFFIKWNSKNLFQVCKSQTNCRGVLPREVAWDVPCHEEWHEMCHEEWHELCHEVWIRTFLDYEKQTKQRSRGRAAYIKTPIANGIWKSRPCANCPGKTVRE